MSKKLHAACAIARACADASPVPSTNPWSNVIEDSSGVRRYLRHHVDHGQGTFLRLGFASIKVLASRYQATSGQRTELRSNLTDIVSSIARNSNHLDSIGCSFW